MAEHAFLTGAAFWASQPKDVTLKGPVTLTHVKICGACGDWLEAGQEACLIEETYEDIVLDDYTHWACAQDELARRTALRTQEALSVTPP